jgi:radical SAM protein with 4Fe4S-binding SPASM domain
MVVNRFIKSENAVTAGVSYLKSRIRRKSSISVMPVAVGIEISGLCNLHCPECSCGSGIMTRKGGLMDIDMYKKIILELRPYLYHINLFFQGEPMLHPQFFEFLDESVEINITVSTNGHYLSEENSLKLARSGLNKIIISLDGMDEETYSMYRQGGEFEKVVRGIRTVSQSIRSTGSSLKLEIQFLVNRHNEGQILTVRRFSEEVGATLRLKSMQIINKENFESWLPYNEKFKRYKKDETDFKIKSSLNNHCLRLWLNPVITWDGKVVPCCFDKNANHIMGDLKEDTFRTIWHGEQYRMFRDSVLVHRKEIGICRNCTSGLRGVIY